MDVRHVMEPSVTESHNHFATLPSSGGVPGTTWGLTNSQCSARLEGIHFPAGPIGCACLQENNTGFLQVSLPVEVSP